MKKNEAAVETVMDAGRCRKDWIRVERVEEGSQKTRARTSVGRNGTKKGLMNASEASRTTGQSFRRGFQCSPLSEGGPLHAHEGGGVQCPWCQCRWTWAVVMAPGHEEGGSAQHGLAAEAVADRAQCRRRGCLWSGCAAPAGALLRRQFSASVARFSEMPRYRLVGTRDTLERVPLCSVVRWRPIGLNEPPAPLTAPGPASTGLDALSTPDFFAHPRHLTARRSKVMGQLWLPARDNAAWTSEVFFHAPCGAAAWNWSFEHESAGVTVLHIMQESYNCLPGDSVDIIHESSAGTARPSVHPRVKLAMTQTQLAPFGDPFPMLHKLLKLILSVINCAFLHGDGLRRLTRRLSHKRHKEVDLIQGLRRLVAT